MKSNIKKMNPNLFLNFDDLDVRTYVRIVRWSVGWVDSWLDKKRDELLGFEEMMNKMEDEGFFGDENGVGRHELIDDLLRVMEYEFYLQQITAYLLKNYVKVKVGDVLEHNGYEFEVKDVKYRFDFNKKFFIWEYEVESDYDL
jgi:hypothetical protein